MVRTNYCTTTAILVLPPMLPCFHLVPGSVILYQSLSLGCVSHFWSILHLGRDPLHDTPWCPHVIAWHLVSHTFFTPTLQNNQLLNLPDSYFLHKSRNSVYLCINIFRFIFGTKAFPAYTYSSQLPALTNYAKNHPSCKGEKNCKDSSRDN